jgi:PTS system nitrogen regulatory IIA component
MRIADLLTLDRVACDSPAASKKRLLETVGNLIADSKDALSRSEIFTSLLSRERLGSTGLGNGIALPHGRVQRGHHPVGAFVRLARPIDYDALDGQPVDLVFALVIPEDSTQQHLEILASLAEMFSDRAFCDRLRQAPTPQELLGLISDWSPGPPPT